MTVIEEILKVQYLHTVLTCEIVSQHPELFQHAVLWVVVQQHLIILQTHILSIRIELALEQVMTSCPLTI